MVVIRTHAIAPRVAGDPASSTDPASAVATGPSSPWPPSPTGNLFVTVPVRLAGPPGTGNGGWVSGTVASFLRPGPAEVTLRAPTPLDVPLRCEWEPDAARLYAPDPDAGNSGAGGDGGRAVLVEARAVWHSPVPPPFVDVDVADRAQAGFLGYRSHPFPGCVVCGVDRAPGDGMRIHPGPVAGMPGVVAAPWAVSQHLAGPDGRVPEAAIWGSLDCPTAWAHLTEGAAALLGRITVSVVGTVTPGATYVVVARLEGVDGRKAFANAGLYDTGGTLIASSRATWINITAPR